MTTLYCNGMYRSGSTFTFNLCTKLHKDYKEQVPKPNKIHEKWARQASPKDILVYSYRDIRISTASLMRKKGLTVSTFTNYYKAGLVPWLEMLVDYDEHVKASANKKLILRYERDIVDVQTAIVSIADFFNVELPHSKLKEYNNIFNILAAKTYVDSLMRHDPKTQYHPNHISTDKTEYQDYFDSNEYANSTKIKDWLSKNNY